MPQPNWPIRTGVSLIALNYTDGPGETVRDLSGMHPTTFADLSRDIFRLHASGSYEEALELLNTVAHHFPQHEHSTIIWKAGLAALTGQASLATWALEEGLAAGWWWGPELLTDDPDFASLQDDGDFQRIVEQCRRRQVSEQAGALASMLLAVPPGPGPHPVLIALHGNAWSAAAFSHNWSAAVAAGWALAVPQSSQMSGPERYGWLKKDQARAEIARHLETLKSHALLDIGRLVAAGFSSGARLALDLVADGSLPAAKLMCIGLSSPPDTSALASRHIDVRLFRAHEFPSNFAEELTKWLG